MCVCYCSTYHKVVRVKGVGKKERAGERLMRKATGEEGDHARSLGMMKKLGRDEQKLGQGAKYVC